jgi:16S rRNA A1518/A1519 N6-dimethyltransferase RsmA/KsgA/DIM1 with predicted DNA glycosylase/AP lyase activity
MPSITSSKEFKNAVRRVVNRRYSSISKKPSGLQVYTAMNRAVAEVLREMDIPKDQRTKKVQNETFTQVCHAYSKRCRANS